MREDLIPDVSLGTHFLNELVEMNMLYVAVFPDHQENYINKDFFSDAKNSLTELVPGAERWAEMIKVIRATDLAEPREVRLQANARKQEVVCFLKA